MSLHSPRLRTTLGTTVALALAATVRAQVPQIVKDVNTTPKPALESSPRALTAHLGSLFYVAEDGVNGPDLRRMDTAGNVTFLLDTREADGPESVTAGGASLFFATRTSLYRTDGTPAGTVRVRSFPSDDIGSLRYANGYVFFLRNVGGPVELWRSDGTDAGTISLGEMNPEELTAADGRVFFFRTTPATGREPWTSDGTVAGTMMVADVCPGTCGGGDVADEVATVGGTAFFRGDDGVHGNELWRSDGTPAGTSMVIDALPGTDGLDPNNLTRFGNRLLFAGYQSSVGLWITDGTAPGTRRLKADFWASDTIHDAGGRAFFGATDFSGERTVSGLWTTDGTAAGTRLVSPICRDGCPSIHDFGTLGGLTVFTPYLEDSGEYELWRTDGTTAGTSRISAMGSLGGLVPFANALYYRGYDVANGNELWRTDGTAAGTVRVTNRAESPSFPTFLSNLGARMFFTAERPDIGREMWATTGSPASTTLLDLTPGPGSSFVGSATDLGGNLIFDVSGAGQGLWKSDGTPAGTKQLKPDLRSFAPAARTGDVLILSADAGSNYEPWKTDGTEAGTERVADLNPGFAPSSPFSLVPFRGQVAFLASGIGYPVWSTDGTDEGTYRITPRTCLGIAAVDEKLFMSCIDSGAELWVTDGTELGTRLVRDGFDGVLQELVAVEDRLYFKDGSGRIWRSDGTTTGTRLLSDIVGFPTGDTAIGLTRAGRLLFYTATTDASGWEVWRTDGTAAGTQIVRDILPGPDSGVPNVAVAAAGNRVVFTAYTPATGYELWRSDGTTAGTVPFGEIAPGPASSRPQNFRYAAGRVYFMADDNVTGFEPWSVALPPAVTVSIGDAVLQEGDTGTRDAVFEVRLETAASSVVTVGYATAAGSAQAGSDFTPRSGTLTFQPGQTLASIAVPVVGDLADEADETFTVELSGAAAFADQRGVGVVIDDDGPAATIASLSVAEGDAGTTNAAFGVTLTTKDGAATTAVQTVGFRTEPLTAAEGTDYLATTGTITFPSGAASGTTLPVTIPVVGDTLDEPDERFLVRLLRTSDTNVASQTASGTIVDDDGIASATPVELAHGTVVRATLAPPPGRSSDLDWYVLRQDPRSSYELVADETSGDAIPLRVERMGADGSVLQSAVAAGTGGSVSLRWQNTSVAAVADEAIRVGSAACGTACGADDTYRLRFVETTLRGTRVNNSGGQVTAIVLQNVTSQTIAGQVQFWTPGGGGPFNGITFQLPARGVVVLDSTTFGTSGSLTVMHDGPYGGLVGKAVSLQPSTGFSFDTPLAPRPR